MSGPRVLGARVWSWRQLVREADGDEELALRRLADMPGYGEYHHDVTEPGADPAKPCRNGHVGERYRDGADRPRCAGCLRDSAVRYRDKRAAA